MGTTVRSLNVIVDDMRSLFKQDLEGFLGDASKVDLLNQKADQLQSEAKAYKSNKDSDGKKIIDAYATLLRGLAVYDVENKKKSIKILEDAADSFSKAGYSIEAFELNLLLCSMYYGLEDEKNAHSCGVKALEHGSNIDQTELANYRNFKQMRFLTKLILNRRDLINDNKSLIFLLSEKLLTINKNAHRDEYNEIKTELFTTIKNAAHELIVQRKFDEALNFLKSYGFSIDLFLKEFNDLVDEFLDKPDAELMKVLLKICNMDSNIPYAKTALASWKQNVITAAAALFAVDPLLIPTVPENKPILEHVLGDTEMASLFMENVVGLTEALVEDPQHKDIMSVFLVLNETLGSLGRSSEMATVNLLIQATLQLRKTSKTANTYATTLVKIFKDTSGRFAPMALIRSFYNTVFAPRNNKRDMNACDALAQFVGEVNETVLSFPDSNLKNQLLQEIGSINEILTQNYHDTMLSRINSLSFDRFLQGNPVVLLKSIIGDLIPQHPIPFIEALDWLLSEWRRFPLFEKTQYIQYGRTTSYPPSYGAYQIATQRLKPIIWLILFKDIYIVAFQDVQHRLMKNTALQHRTLIRTILGYINFLHHLQICFSEEPSVPRTDVRQDVIGFLKKMNDMVQLSDAEMEGLIRRSEWRGESKQLLAQVIEFKNFCVYCNFNMEHGAKVCKNCGKDVPPVTIEPPKYILGDMSNFLSQSTSQGMPTPVAATQGVQAGSPAPAQPPTKPASQVDSMQIRKCPKCGGLISADDNKCILCQYQMP